MNADRAQLAQKERILAKNSSVHPLIKVHTTESGYAAARELGTWRKPEVANLSDDLLESCRCDDVVVHQDQVLLRTVELFDAPHDSGERLGVPLLSFKLWDP